ncbi:MAG TPA: hypothetical protein VFO28_06310 [Burkholderiaceae bacterium]|nr:hypothetical protein [Burkholderiaceae bacterium]
MIAAADLEQIATYGLLAMFGSVPLTAPIGWLIGRRAGFEGGVSLVLLVFGLAAAAAAVWLTIHVHLQTAVVIGTRTGCDVLADGTARERYEIGAPVRPAVVAQPSAAFCDRSTDEPTRLRVRRAADADGVLRARHEQDPRQANALIGVFGAFGGFGLLAGLFFAVTTLRRQRGVAPTDVRMLSPRRQRLGQGFTIAGNLSMVGCALTAAFADLDAVRSGMLVFGGATAGCLSFALAMVARRSLALEAALILAIVGGGCALAALSLWYLG